MKKEAHSRQRARRAVANAFWDTSALVPLCCFQPPDPRALDTARVYTQDLVWCGKASPISSQAQVSGGAHRIRLPFVHRPEMLVEGVRRLAAAWEAYDQSLGTRPARQVIV